MRKFSQPMDQTREYTVLSKVYGRRDFAPHFPPSAVDPSPASQFGDRGDEYFFVGRRDDAQKLSYALAYNQRESNYRKGGDRGGCQGATDEVRAQRGPKETDKPAEDSQEVLGIVWINTCWGNNGTTLCRG